MRSLVVFLFFMSMIMGGSFTLYRYYDYDQSPDCKDYMKMAQLDYDGTSPVRRYRPIIPTIVNLVATVLSPVYYKIWKDKLPSDLWVEKMGFYLVNVLMMTFSAYFMFLGILKYSGDFWSSIIAVLAFTSSIWCAYITGPPMVDSIYHLAIIWMFFGLLLKNQTFVYLSILLGPFAKESFVFFVPLIFWYTMGNINKVKVVLCMTLSFALVIGFRFWLDHTIGTVQEQSLNADLQHFEYIGYSLSRIFSVKGILDIFSVFGFFSCLLIFVLFDRSIVKQIPSMVYVFLAIIVLHMLLSTEVSRMFYFFAGPICLVFAIILKNVNRRFDLTKGL